MSIIKKQELTSDLHKNLLNFLNDAKDQTHQEILAWICLWKVREKANFYLAKNLCVLKTVEEMRISKNFNILSNEEAKKIYENTIAIGGKIITPKSLEYPQCLKEIVNFPLVLHALGNCEILKKKMVAIVGSRSASVDALKIAYNFAEDLGKNGIAVVSGFANGVDTSACNGALKYGTVQVLGSGLDSIYPKNNKELFTKVLQNGGLFLSEFPANTPALPDNFPTRNRIITGISQGILIGQVNRKAGVSGTLVTLRIAISQGKEIFAYPGNILDERSTISNNLIKNGTAHFTTCVEDILNIVGTSTKKYDLFSFQSNEKSAIALENIEKSLSKNDKKLVLEEDKQIIYNTLSIKAISVNDITAITGFKTAKVQEILSELELMGEIAMDYSGKYSIAI